LEARVKNLALFHYGPDLTDQDVAGILVKTRQVFPRTLLAKEGLEIALPLGNILPD
jgi:hypothetical protein